MTKQVVLACPECGSEDYGTNGCGNCGAPDPEFDNDQHYPERFGEDGEVLAFVGTCQSCGRYLDVRQHERCPSPCDGYIG